ncbi:C4-dicarboxylate ABC transporter substrate-binding protein [Trinickia violacea]|uniref:C4-dicarboxylate ABC transporter substrate-binding protein n=1 Tax=Trinickia violacea TaxID=2571746 RepID=A0A4P8IU01_9BURK|nr:TAXI family TRAP transporter solute-binding subunit [Trinickia violacea]QCP52728.1 C4-dicarboxylate ABC transporter substrate-binding protein [Trinickia violacea]
MKRYRPHTPNFLRDHAHPVWRDLALTAVPVIVLFVATIAAIIWLIDPAPPKTITMSAGPRNSIFMQAALEYKKILARNGVTLNVLESDGSVENLHRLLDPKQHVDFALVQGGVADGVDTSKLTSLGSIRYLPIAVFYRGNGVTHLADLDGKRIAIGREGSGTRVLSLKLLAANGIVPGGTTTLLPYDGLQAATELIKGNIDAALFSGDSATREMMQGLLTIPGITALDFTEASAYTRLFPYLNEIDLPRGVLDLQRTVPRQTIHLIGPTVEIIARPSLHPAISDLIIEAAQEVHGSAGLLQSAGQFPNPVAQDFPISQDATRYYKSGKSFFYRYLPFWLATVTDRLLVLLLPVAVLLIPGLRLIPALFRWRVRSRIYRYYGALIAIERSVLDGATEDERQQLMAELDDIEDSLNHLRMPLAYADAFYVLREHVGFVRAHLNNPQWAKARL